MVMMVRVITVWMMWHVVTTIDMARGAGIWVVVLGDVAMALGPGSSSLGCCSLLRTVTWWRASGLVMGGHW